MTSLGSDVRAAIERFERVEGTTLPRLALGRPVIAAAGSVADKALASPLLHRCLEQRDIRPLELRPYGGLNDLLQASDWSLSLILSPFKQRLQGACSLLAPSAEQSEVVDTVLQAPDGTRIGVNTNAYGVALAVECLMGRARPERCLIAGTGASTRSCVVGLRDVYPEMEIGVVGRDSGRTSRVAEELSLTVIEDPAEYAPGLTINATTVGETGDEETMELPLEGALSAGTRFLDLNNRTSQLQMAAVAGGCVTLAGTVMQLAVNTLRAHLLCRSSPEDAREARKTAPFSC